MAKPLNRMWRVAKDFEGAPSDEDITWHEEPAREPADGDVLVQITHAVVDPMLWSILPPPGKDEPMPGAALGVVIESRAATVKVGDKVSGLLGWQTHACIPAAKVVVHDATKNLKDEDYLGVVSYVGATAFIGVREITKPSAGETFVVTAAAGAVGSLAGQLAKLDGARVVGIATTAEQCAWLTELGFDVTIDRQAEDLGPALARTCPDGINALVDGLGGSVLDACLARLAVNARVALFATGLTKRPPPGPIHFASIANKRARVQGYSFLDFPLQLGAALETLATLVTDGTLRYRLDILDGLEHAPAAMRRIKAEAGTIVLRTNT
ncbi:MAG TPA: NADP-dependent oxidoreductase [Kofleriaceae bacterium]|nr:NADP-dependent oxidoreductase [Kofleriaceae bacterium]